MLKWLRLTSLFIAWSECNHIFANPSALLKRALFEIFGVDTGIEGILGCFEICIIGDLTCLLLFLTILKLLLKHWYLMRLFWRTVLVVLRQKSVVIGVSVPFGACVARVETINGCRIHWQDASCCNMLLLLLWNYISTHHQQAWLSSCCTGEWSVVLTWLHYYAVI